MGPVGVQEMVVIFLVALLLFGPKKLPELGKTLAKAVSEFRRAQSDLKATFEREMKSLEQESESLREATRQASIDIGNFSSFDLTGGTSSTYGAETHPANTTDWHGVESGAPTTVSASEVPGAESHGSVSQETVSHGSAEIASPAEETVARGTIPRAEKATPAAVAEAPLLLEDPLHETRNN